MWKTMLRVQPSFRDRIRYPQTSDVKERVQEMLRIPSLRALLGIWTHLSTDSCLPRGIYAAAMPFGNFPTMTEASTTSRLQEKVEDGTSCLLSNGNLSDTRTPRHSHSPYQSSCLCACAREVARLDHECFGTRGWNGSNYRSKNPRPGRYCQFLVLINGEHIGLLKNRYSFLLNLKSPCVAAKDDCQFVSSRMMNVQSWWNPVLLLTLLCGIFYVLILKARKGLQPTIGYPQLRSYRGALPVL